MAHLDTMSNHIPSTLKTGLGSAGYVEQESIDAMTKRLISTVFVMTREASDLAYKIAVHDNRDQATSGDVNAALKYQARHFLHTLDDPGVVTGVMSVEHDIFENRDEEVEMMPLPDEDEIRSTAVMSEDGKCVCETCEQVRHSTDTWDDWEPDDEAEAFLRHSVDQAILNFEALHKEQVEEN